MTAVLGLTARSSPVFQRCRHQQASVSFRQRHAVLGRGLVPRYQRTPFRTACTAKPGSDDKKVRKVGADSTVVIMCNIGRLSEWHLFGSRSN